MKHIYISAIAILLLAPQLSFAATHSASATSNADALRAAAMAAAAAKALANNIANPRLRIAIPTYPLQLKVVCQGLLIHYNNIKNGVLPACNILRACKKGSDYKTDKSVCDEKENSLLSIYDSMRFNADRYNRICLPKITPNYTCNV